MKYNGGRLVLEQLLCFCTWKTFLPSSSYCLTSIASYKKSAQDLNFSGSFLDLPIGVPFMLFIYLPCYLNIKLNLVKSSEIG